MHTTASYIIDDCTNNAACLFQWILVQKLKQGGAGAHIMQMSLEIVLKFCRGREFTRQICIMHVSYAVCLLTQHNLYQLLTKKTKQQQKNKTTL